MRSSARFSGLIMQAVQSISSLATRGETPQRLASPRVFAPLLLADWMRAVFIHYEVDPAALQREIPFQLDLWKGRAFVSLVAFTMERLRPSVGGRVAELAFKPIASTRFLNVRTYARHRGEPGIYFIAEFLSNRLCVPLGPPTFGLPYRFGNLIYEHNRAGRVVAGTVNAAGGRCRLAYRAQPASEPAPQESGPETLDSFLLERYAAFTCRGAKRRRFHIWHPPWPQFRIEPVVQDEGLLATTGKWIENARLIGGNYSPGVRGVWMGSPRRIYPPAARRRLTVFFDA